MQRPEEDEPAGLLHAQSPPVQLPNSTNPVAHGRSGLVSPLTVRSAPTQQPRWPGPPQPGSTQTPSELDPLGCTHAQPPEGFSALQLPSSSSPAEHGPLMPFALRSPMQQPRWPGPPQVGAVQTPKAYAPPLHTQFGSPTLQPGPSTRPALQEFALPSSRKQQARWPGPPHNFGALQMSLVLNAWQMIEPPHCSS